MMDLPSGWAWTTLDEIGDYLNGRAFKQSEWSTQGRPIVRIQNLTGSSSKFNHFEGNLAERYIVQPGDHLVSWAATLGSFIWQGPEAALNQHIFKVNSHIDKKFHHYLIRYLIDELATETHGSGMVHVTRGKFGNSKLALPPLTEQRRIVAALEDHLSRLDAAADSIKEGRRRAKKLIKRIIVESVPIPAPAHWKVITVGEAGKVDLGRQRHPDWHVGPNMRPYLRVANVFEDRIDDTDIMEMDFPPEIFDRFRLKEGDILLNEGQSPEYLGRPAMYRGAPEDVAFTNSLLRFQAGPGILPEWALLVFRRHLHARRFIREVRITTNLAHLSAARFKSIEFPIPTVDEQKEIAERVDENLTSTSRLIAQLDIAQHRNMMFRRSLFTEAFAGRLVPQDSNDEPASKLLERIRTEQATMPKSKHTRRSTKKGTDAAPVQETLL